jgi:hypothetical protein
MPVKIFVLEATPDPVGRDLTPGSEPSSACDPQRRIECGRAAKQGDSSQRKLPFPLRKRVPKCRRFVYTTSIESRPGGDS